MKDGSFVAIETVRGGVLTMANSVGDASYCQVDYVEYQSRYRKVPASRDRALVDLLRTRVGAASPGTLLDIGCHQGNLLALLRSAFPGWRLQGGDLWAEVIAQNRADPELADIEFSVMDIRSLPRHLEVDVIVANAVLFRFDQPDFLLAVSQIAQSLKNGGSLIAFDWYHHFDQELRIEEYTPDHPDGLLLHMRSQASVESVLTSAGFSDITFHAFEIPVDLSSRDQSDALHTRTETLADGRRLQFRGALYQPWCHLMATFRGRDSGLSTGPSE